MRNIAILSFTLFIIFATSCNGLTKKLWNWHNYEEDSKKRMKQKVSKFNYCKFTLL